MAEHDKRGFTGSEAQETARGQKISSNVDQPVSAAETAKSLAGVDFPANRDDLVAHAKKTNSRQAVIDIIHAMADKRYDNMADVEHEFSQAKKRE